MSPASAPRWRRSICGFLPGYSLLIAAILAGALFGAAFAAIPGYLQAKRDSHIVITTIMFNYIATALMGYLLVNVFRVPGSMATESRGFPPNAIMPQIHDLLKPLGIDLAGDAAQSFLSARARLRALRLGADLAHSAWL